MWTTLCIPALLPQVASNKHSPPLCRAAVAAALGCLSRDFGAKVGSLGGDSVSSCVRQLTFRELELRRAAIEALAQVIEV